MALGNDQNLNIIVRLKDEASKQLEGLRGKFENLQKNMVPATNASKAFAIGLGGAATAAAGFGALAIKAAMGAQTEMIRVKQTVNNTLEQMNAEGLNKLQKLADAAGGAGSDVFEFMSASIDKAAASAAKLGFDDEEAAGTLAKLFQRTNDVNEAMKLNQLAMDLARAKGIGLAEAGDMIGMVMSGNGRALKAYGIEINDTLSPMDALAELQTKVAGQADAFSGSLAGQTEALKVAFGNLMETIGEQLVPVALELVKAATPIIEKLIEWAGKTGELVGWLKEHEIIIWAVAGAIAGGLAPAILFSLIPAIWGMITAFAAGAVALAPWLIGGAIIGGLVAGIIWVVKNWDKVKEQFKLIWEGLKIMFKEGVNALIGLAEGWANSWVKAANVIIGALNKVSFSIPDWVPGVGGKSFSINLPLAQEAKLPRLEHGGIVPGARGTAVPIIAHGQEQIIPAGNAKGNGDININLTLNYPQFNSQKDTEIVRQQIETALRDVVRVYKLQSS